MQKNRVHRIVATLIIAVCVGFSACGGSATPEGAASTNASSMRAPAGSYESRLPDGTVIQLRFRDGGAVTIVMMENGATNSFDGKWIVNGEVILVEGGEGMTMQLSWRDASLVTDFGGVTLTFNRS